MISLQLLCDLRDTNLRTWFTVLDGLELDLGDFGPALVVHARTELACLVFVCVDTLAVSMIEETGLILFPCDDDKPCRIRNRDCRKGCSLWDDA